MTSNAWARRHSADGRRSRASWSVAMDRQFERAPELADELGYVPLTPELYARARARFDAGERGTHFLTEDGGRREGTLVELYR